MTHHEQGYAAGQAAAIDNPRAFAIAPKGPIEWQAGWRAGFRAEISYARAAA
jgi:hypothetical protein